VKRSSTAALVGLAALLVAALALGVALGSAERPTAEILWQIPVPRVLLGACIGAGLAASGAMLQALLQNPLADPYLLGISGGATLGGALALGLGVGAAPVSVPAFAFLGALASTALLYAVAGSAGRAPGHSLLLTGVVFNAFAGAPIVFLAVMLDPARMAGVFLWLVGSVRTVDPATVAAVALLVGVGLALGIAHAYPLNLLSLGEETATHLGVSAVRVRRIVLLATALLVGASVAVSGLVGFVGLIVPHLLRILLGADHRVLVPASALFGAALLVVADTLARVALAPTELPVGAITALLGGPFFLFLLRRELARLAR
jgi:iron complex transport system permease protein